MTQETGARERPEEIDAPEDEDLYPEQQGGREGEPGRAALAPPPLRPAPEEQLEKERSAEQVQRRREGRRGRLWAAALGALAIGIALFLTWRAGQPVPVEVVRPVAREITETVAASGEVGGRRETAVGAQAQGVVAELWVDEGSVVTRRQPLARIRNDVAQAQVQQAEQALRTAQAQLAQAAAGARPSELNAARAQVRQAEAQVRQAGAQLDQTRAAIVQEEARLELARRNLERYRYLLGEGAIARQTVDQAEAEYRTATAAVTAAQEGVATARANVAAARAAAAAARAQLRTLAEGPRAEAVEVAQQRVRDAQAALQVAREQAQNFVVRAPFAGTVTEVLAEPGAFVGPTSGVVRLVQTTLPEIRLDVDESSLADLRVGQRAVITSSTFREARLEGRVARIGAQVDATRGTVEVTVVLELSPEWLRPGQTVNVNIITAERVRRLVVPGTAVRRVGDRRSVLVVRDGRAVAQPVIVGPVEGSLVPVIEGLAPDDQVVRHADRVEPGARVRIDGT